jgi:hypothetical protein
MKNDVNRQVRLKARPTGIPQAEHFELVEAALPAIGDGQVLVRNLYLSVEPAMRGWVSAVANYSGPVPLGAVIRSIAAGKVVESRHPDYRAGDLVIGMFGWQDFAAVETSAIQRKATDPDLPLTAWLGVLGLNGFTAYFGLLDIGRLKAGETVAVSTAAGSVGSCVGQIAKIKGCRTGGIADAPAKTALRRDAFGYDAAVDYRHCWSSGRACRACSSSTMRRATARRWPISRAGCAPARSTIAKTSLTASSRRRARSPASIEATISASA